MGLYLLLLAVVMRRPFSNPYPYVLFFFLKFEKTGHMPVWVWCVRVRGRKAFGSTNLYVRAKEDAEHNHPSLLCAAEMITPATVLPEANSTTIHNRWQQWALAQADGPGKKLCGDSDLMVEYKAAQWCTAVMTKDNLVVNDCITVADPATITVDQ